MPRPRIDRCAPIKHPGGDPSLKQALLHRVRGKVLLLLCFMYMITYIDRVNISTAAPFIKDDLGLSNTQLGLALSAFSIPYAFFQIFGGMIGDRFGPRKVLGIVGLMWGVVHDRDRFRHRAVHARSPLDSPSGSARVPRSPRRRTPWRSGYPPSVARSVRASPTPSPGWATRSRPVIIAVLIALWGWRESFWVVGAISLVWVFFWVRYFRDNPKDHPKITQEELDELPAYQTADPTSPRRRSTGRCCSGACCR